MLSRHRWRVFQAGRCWRTCLQRIRRCTFRDWFENGTRSGNGDDVYGFAALPAGTRTMHDDFNALGEYAFFWTSTEYHTAYDPKYTQLDDTEGLSEHANHISFVNKSDWPNYAQYGLKILGHSVRCVKNFNK